VISFTKLRERSPVLSPTHLQRWAIWTAALLAVLPAFLCLAVVRLAEAPATEGSTNLGTAALFFGLLLALLLGASLALFFLAVLETAGGGPPGVQSSWGGLGGGLGGWRLSPSLVYFLGALFLAGLFGYVTHRIVGSQEFHAWSGVPAASAGDQEEKPPADAGTSTGAETGTASPADSGTDKTAQPGGETSGSDAGPSEQTPSEPATGG